METADRLLSLRQCYEDYMNDRRAMLQEGGAFQGVSRFFTGPPAGERMIAKRFLQQVEEWLAQLDREDAARLLRGNAARYPKRRQLLPKQEEVLNALVRAAG